MVETKEKQVGVVSSYFSHAEVAAIKLSAGLNVGDKVHVKLPNKQTSRMHHAKGLPIAW